MEGLRVLRDDQACTYGVGPSAGQGNPGDPALLPSNYSCLDRCLRLPRLPAWEASRLLLRPWAGRWLGTWISRTMTQWGRGRVLVADLDSGEPPQPSPLPLATQADRRHCPPFQECLVSAAARLLPGEEIRVLVPDFPVAVGGQGGQEGGRGDALGLLGSVAVPDSRNSRGSPRHTGVLEGPVLYSLVLLGSQGSRGSLDAPLPVLLRRDPLLLVVLLDPAEVLLLPLPRNCQETADFYLVIMSSM